MGKRSTEAERTPLIDDTNEAASTVAIDAPFSDDDKPATPPKKAVPFVSLFRFATSRDRLLMLLGSVAAIVTGSSIPAMSYLFGSCINQFLQFAVDPTFDLRGHVLTYVFYFLYLAAASFVAAYLQMWAWMLSGVHQSRRIRVRYLKALLSQEIGFHDQQKGGELTSKLTQDVDLIQDGISEKVGTFIQTLSTFFVAFGVGFFESWKMTLVLLSIVPLLAIVGGFMMKLMTSLATRGQEAYARAGGVAEEVLSSIKTVVSFNGSPKETQRFDAELETALKSGIKKSYISAAGIGVTLLLIYSSYALGFSFGAIEVEKGDMEGGDVVTVFFSVIIGAFALGRIGPDMQAFSDARGAAANVWAIVDRVPRICALMSTAADENDDNSPDTLTNDESPNDNFKCTGRISLENVHFAYATRPDVSVINGLSLSLSPGQTVALVGGSGCGKSTIVSLIERFYDCTSGAVLLDGIDIRNIPVNTLRTHIGIVSQEPVLFNASIRDNIAYGLSSNILVQHPQHSSAFPVSDERIEKAARLANAHDFILSLPLGYSTMCGEKGQQLSGGQRQRIAIARAIISEPKILLLDEATSALDSESELIVQQALDRASAGRTTVVVAHRLSTIQNADRIAVLDGGKIVEEGTFEELSAMEGGHFRALLEAQQKRTANHDTLDVALVSADQEEEIVMAGSGMGAAAKRAGGDAVCVDVVSESRDGDDETEESAPTTHESIPMSRVLKLNAPEKWWIIVGLGGAIGQGALMPVFSIVFSQMMSTFTETGQQLKDDALFWSMMFLVLAGGAGITVFMQSAGFGVASEKLTSRLRSMLFRAMLRQEMAFFDAPENATGALSTRLSTDAPQIRGMSGVRLGLILQMTVTILAGLIIAFLSAWRLSLVILACSPLALLGGVMSIRRMTGFAAGAKEAMQESGRLASEAIASVRTVHALRRESDVIKEYRNALSHPYKLDVRRAFIAGIGFAIAQSFVLILDAVSFWYGSIEVSKGNLDFAQMFRAFTALVFGAMALGQTSSLAPDYAKARASANNIFAILDRTSAIDPSEAHVGLRPESARGDVAFENVSFAYPTRKNAQVLKNVSLDIRSGETVALVGPSGCGKSTTCSLIQRFYDVDRETGGQILFDTHPVASLNVAWLRAQMATVSQEPTLFHTTVRENILYSVPRDEFLRWEAEMIRCAKEANAHDFIMEIGGYDTQVGDKGTKISGGQKQRISVARALLCDPKALILDEATSALDNVSQATVQEALDRACANRTTLIVAHRLSTIRHANRIVCMEKGAVVEEGSHDDLMARDDGLYRRLVARQLQDVTH